jgi:hypothetical protein
MRAISLFLIAVALLGVVSCRVAGPTPTPTPTPSFEGLREMAVDFVNDYRMVFVSFLGAALLVL